MCVQRRRTRRRVRRFFFHAQTALARDQLLDGLPSGGLGVGRRGFACHKQANRREPPSGPGGFISGGREHGAGK